MPRWFDKRESFRLCDLCVTANEEQVSVAIDESLRAAYERGRDEAVAHAVGEIASEPSQEDTRVSYERLVAAAVPSIGNTSIGALFRLALGGENASDAEARLARGLIVFRAALLAAEPP